MLMKTNVTQGASIMWRTHRTTECCTVGHLVSKELLSSTDIGALTHLSAIGSFLLGMNL